MRTFVFIVHQNNLVPYIYMYIYIDVCVYIYIYLLERFLGGGAANGQGNTGLLLRRGRKNGRKNVIAENRIYRLKNRP